jgi:hypothetical protein
MFGRKLRVWTVGLLVLALGVTAALADEVDDSVPAISDGRVNSLDIAAPLAVYCQFDYPYADDENVGVLDEIEIWAFVGDEIQKVISASAADLENGAGLIASGYALYLEDDGSLTASGANYAFNWQHGETDNC